MKRPLTVPALFVLLLFLTLVPFACSDDDDPTGGNGEVDTTPPGVVSVTAVDASHVVVVFNEAVDKTSAEDTDHYLFVEGVSPSPYVDLVPASAGDTLWLATAVLGGDGRTVTTTTWSDMNDAPYNYQVTGVKDLRGNTMSAAAAGSFDGTVDPDLTPPTITSHTPVSGATGVPLLQTVVIVFSEAMDYSSVYSALTWTGGGGPVSYDLNARETNVFELHPQAPLQHNTQYTVTVGGTATDLAGNPLTPTSWNFRTTATVDNTAPTLVSTTPADGATSVPVTTNFQLQFSEAIDRYSMDGVVLTPEVGDGVDSWSGDGTTVTFDPDDDLLDNTQYTMVIGQGTITDLSGNPIEESVIVRFTTGASLESGSISGQLAGDPGTGAANPQDAVVVASSIYLFEYNEEGPPPIEGADIAGAAGIYSVDNLVDGTYWPVAMKESNGDGYLEFELGDAVGAYGADFGADDFSPLSVTISGGAPVTDIDFPLTDPSAVAGNVSYGGSSYSGTWWTYDYYVGLFDQNPFAGGTEPLIGVGPYNLGSEPDYLIHEFDEGFPDGTYWLGAYLDVNTNGNYDPAVDPAGYYMTGASIDSITVANGSDALHVDVVIYDPSGFAARTAGWRIPPRSADLEARADQWRRMKEFFSRVVETRR